MTQLLTTSTKIEKSNNYGTEYRTSIMYALPATQSGHNACPDAGICADMCIDTTGRMPMARQARENRSNLFYDDRAEFGAQLIAETNADVRRNEKKSLRTAQRLNGTTDYAWEHIRFDGLSMMDRFEDVQYYDYTKSLKRARQHANGAMPSNYHLTFSRSEDTPDATVIELVQNGQNVAVVFDVVPTTWLGLTVINGDAHDLRFLDPSGVIIGLKEKGKAKKDASGFVVRLNS
jgi:hypothetical protein